MIKQLVRLAIIFMLVSVACSLPVSINMPQTDPQPKGTAVAQVVVTANPNAPSTPTPFQPVGATATSAATATFTVTPQPTSTINPIDEVVGIDLPTPVRISQPMPEGQVNVLVMGSDYRPQSGYRTDVMMLVSINTKTGTVSAISFPRDLYVTIPGWTTQRLNTAHPHGGFSMMQDTFEYNFGVRPKYYIMTNFQGFVGIVNSLGGVDVNVGQNLSDTCDLPQRNWAGYCAVNAGVNHMDGATALWYVRSRHTSSDFERTRRAQEVILAIFSKLMSLDAVSRLPELYTSYKSSVETNMGLDDMAPLLPIATQILSDPSRIHRYAVSREHVTPFTTEGGAAVLLPNYEAINAMLQEAIFGQ